MTRGIWKNIEFEIAWPDSSACDLLLYAHVMGVEGYASPEMCLALKESHKYLKDSPHFLKTMRDIQHLKEIGVTMSSWLTDVFLPKREGETYVYSHPNLNVKKGDFFRENEGVNYIYDHDDLHKVLAFENTPAYTKYMRDNSDVMVDMKKFAKLPERIKLLGGLEESLVLSCERSLIPFDFKPDPDEMFEYALQKVCSSITSGKFREFCWNNYDKIVDLYFELGGSEYVNKIKNAIECGELKMR